MGKNEIFSSIFDETPPFSPYRFFPLFFYERKRVPLKNQGGEKLAAAGQISGLRQTVPQVDKNRRGLRD